MITVIEGKIQSISNFATKTALTAVENKIPSISSISSLVKKNRLWHKNNRNWKNTNHNHDKYITTSEFNNLAAAVFDIKLKWAKPVTKTDFNNIVTSLDGKIAANKTKNDSIENEIKKLKTFDSIYFRGKSHFEEDGTENYLVFQPIHRLLNSL